MHTHPIFNTTTIPTTGVEDVNGWAFKRSRTCETTLSPMEVEDAGEEGVDVRAVWHDAYNVDEKPFRKRNNGFAKFNGRWYVPRGCTIVASGLDPATSPGEFIALDDAECAALDRVVAHWARVAATDKVAAEVVMHVRRARDAAERHVAAFAEAIDGLDVDAAEPRRAMLVALRLHLQDLDRLLRFYDKASDGASP